MRPGPLLLGIFAALLTAIPAFGSPPSSISAKQAEARQVLGEVNALDASLGRSDELVNLANLKLASVRRDIAENRRELKVAKHNLITSQRTIAKRLVALYAAGTTSTLEVILGSQSLDEVLTRIDTESRISSVDAQVATQVVLLKTAVAHHAQQLAVEYRQMNRLVAQRERQQHAIETRLGERQRLLSSLNGEVQRLIAAQQARELRASLAAKARIAEAQSKQAQLFATAAIGATAQTPEGASVIPPSSYAGAVGIALQYLGTPYVWAGASPGGFDCSGLVTYAYSQLGISLPHSSYALWNVGVPVPQDQLQPGDLVFFDGLGHMGIYMGGGVFVHAPHTGDVVKVSSLSESWYSATYVGARRVL